MPVYEYEGKHYELPEGMSTDQALDTIESHLGKAKPAAPETPAQSSALQGYGIGMRGAIKGLSFPVNAAADFVSGGVNLASEAAGSDFRMPYLSNLQDKALDARTYEGQPVYPRAQTVGEKVIQGGTEALAGGIASGGVAGRALMPSTPGQVASTVAGGAVAEPIASAEILDESPWIAGAAAMLASVAAGGTAGKAVDKFTKAGAPKVSIADVESRAKAAYSVIDSSGVVVKPLSAQRIVNDIEIDLRRNHNYDPSITPQVATVLNVMRESIGTQRVSFQQLEQLRGFANNLKTNPDPNIKRLGANIIRGFDDGMANVQQRDLMPVQGSNSQAWQTAMDAVKGARSDWRIRAKASLLESVLDDVDITVNRPTASQGELIRDRFIALAKNKNKMAQFSSEDQEAIRAVVRDSMGQKVLAQAGRFSPTRNALTGGAGLGGPTALLATGNAGPAVAMAAGSLGALAADKAGGAIRRGKVESLVQQVLSGKKVSEDDMHRVRGLFGGAITQTGE